MSYRYHGCDTSFSSAKQLLKCIHNSPDARQPRTNRVTTLILLVKFSKTTESLHALNSIALSARIHNITESADDTRKLLGYIEGGVRVRGDAVLRCFWCGFSEIFFLTCGIAVFQDCVVCGNLQF